MREPTKGINGVSTHVVHCCEHSVSSLATSSRGQAAKISQSFMYARPVVDGDDLAIIARSSIHAPNQHDADTATFHRVRDFRKLALKLVPEKE